MFSKVLVLNTIDRNGIEMMSSVGCSQIELKITFTTFLYLFSPHSDFSHMTLQIIESLKHFRSVSPGKERRQPTISPPQSKKTQKLL